MTLSEKLHPDRFSEMSGRMAAIVAYVLGESWTEPAIAALSVTTDGFVTTETEFMGEAADLNRNILNLLIAAELDADEREEFERCYRERVDDWRPSCRGRAQPRDGSPAPTSGLGLPKPETPALSTLRISVRRGAPDIVVAAGLGSAPSAGWAGLGPERSAKGTGLERRDRRASEVSPHS